MQLCDELRPPVGKSRREARGVGRGGELEAAKGEAYLAEWDHLGEGGGLGVGRGKLELRGRGREVRS